MSACRYREITVTVAGLLDRANPVWAVSRADPGAWSPFLILAVEVVNAATRGRGDAVRLVSIDTSVAVAVANIAIEPWPGQTRYRSTAIRGRGRCMIA